MTGAWMEEEVLSQPRVLAANADRYRRELAAKLSGREFEMVVLAARGSSDHAALYARYLIEIRLGIPVVLAAPSVLTVHGRRIRYPKSLVVGVSQSGAAPDVSEVLSVAREEGHFTLAITNEPDSRLAASAEHCLVLGTGEERSVAATKTYTASLLALHQLVAALDPSLPSPALPTDAWVAECLGAAQENSGILVRCQPLFTIGRGYSFATACEAAIKLMECALIPCKAYSSADFQHGPKALAAEGSAIVDFTGELSGVLDQPTEFVSVPLPPPEVSSEVAPIWQIVFGQWLALLSARARGLDADHPRFIRKVTATT
jgi:glucosamine--fructose-6-phosphate aminotransferase (isomerizing)